jgi:polyferredoxin/plastocyanin
MRTSGRKSRALAFWPIVLVVIGCTAPLLVISSRAPASGSEREITIIARQYSFEPHRVTINSGDTVHLRLVSEDVVHGFYLEGHDIEAEVRPGKLSFKVRRPSSDDPFEELEVVDFTAARPGKYRYRCSITCGTLHPFMQGELVIRPNLPFQAGTVGAFGITAIVFGLMLTQRETANPNESHSDKKPWRVDLFERIPSLRWLVTRRWFPFAIILPNVLVLFFFILAGLVGSPIGNRNIIVTIVWILWWFLLIIFMVPFGGRIWCLICPLPFLGEWLSRRRLVSVRQEAEDSKSLRCGSLNRRWPRRFSNLWVQNLLFLCLCSVSTILVTRPALTAVVLGGMLLLAVAIHAIFRRRSFCRYLCPLNAWMSLYSMTAMTEVRPRDHEVCDSCRKRSCVKGTDGAWRCPWLLQPFRLERNNYCGLCMECVKACPNDNLTVNARPFCSDTAVRRNDEAWMAFIMITLVVAYSVTLLGPWGTPREWSNVTEVGNWGSFAIHVGIVWSVALLLVPAVWYLAAWSARLCARSTCVSTHQLFTRYSYLLVPLGLLAWAAFSFPLIMVNYSHITSSLSDPLGWGWDLFGTANHRWSPLLPEWIPLIQIPLLLLGLGLSLARGSVIASELFPVRTEAIRSLIPHAVVCTVITVVLLRLYVG